MNEDLATPRSIAWKTHIYGAASGVDAASLRQVRPAALDDAGAAFDPSSSRPAPLAPTTPFGTWLLGQDHRNDWIGDLTKAAKADRAFPKRSDPDAVRYRLSSMGAEADMFEALAAAEIEWLCF